jgi:hypothetical protein
MKTVVSLLAGLALAAVATGVAHAKGGEVEAALVRCADVTVPGPLTGCGADPLAGGQIEVKRGGDIEVELAGALPSTTYDVVLQTLTGNASAALALGVVTTDASGNAEMHRRNLFDMSQAGPITFALSRNGSVQFVAGFAGEEELKATLLACGDINVPTALPGCGSDTFRSGSVKIDEGDVMVDFTGMPNVSYDVVLLGLDGTSELPLGPLATDKRGRGLLRLMNAFADNVVGAGNVVLRSNGSVEFISGFQSTQRRPPENARFQVGLLRCGAVNTLAPLAGCGSDSFTKGLVTLDEGGDVKVEIVGALPAVQYEVVFVSFDASMETSIGTFTTNPAGNGQFRSHDFFPVGVRGAGNVVIKRDGVDQFVTGFAVVR